MSCVTSFTRVCTLGSAKNAQLEFGRQKKSEVNIKQTGRRSAVGALRKLKYDLGRFVPSCNIQIKVILAKH